MPNQTSRPQHPPANTASEFVSTTETKTTVDWQAHSVPSLVDLSTVILFVFIRLARKGVMSISEAARFLDELTETPNMPEQTRLYLELVIIALSRKVDSELERFYFH